MAEWFSALALTHFFVQGDESIEFAHQAFVDYLVAECYLNATDEYSQQHVALSVDQAYLAFDIAGKNREMLRRIAESAFACIDAEEVKSGDIGLIVLVGKHLPDSLLMHYVEWVREWCVGSERRDKMRGGPVFDRVMAETVYARRHISQLAFDDESVAWLGSRGFAGLRLSECRLEAPSGGMISAVGCPVDMTAAVWTQCIITDLRCETVWRDTVFQKCVVSGLDVAVVDGDGGRFVQTRFLGRNRIVLNGRSVVFRHCVAHTPLHIEADSIEHVRVEGCRADSGIWCRVFVKGVMDGEIRADGGVG